MLDDISRGIRPRRRLRGPLVAVTLALVAVGLAVGLWAFQPWKLLTSSRLDEGLPTPTLAQPTTPAPTPSAVSTEATAPAVLAEGRFVSQEHSTSGVAKILTLPDGSRILRLEDLASSDGPDLHVWLTDQDAGSADGQYDDGRYVPLGKLKATHGNQNYAIPPDTNLTGLHSAVIWCDRFNVAFGSAPLSL
jgi:Electron transfer DM13